MFNIDQNIFIDCKINSSYYVGDYIYENPSCLSNLNSNTQSVAISHNTSNTLSELSYGYTIHTYTYINIY